MAFTRTVDLFIDLNRPGGLDCLLNGAQSSLLTDAPRWMQGDQFTLRLFFRTTADGIYTTSTAATLDAGAELVLAGKEDVDDTTLLFNATGFAAGTDATLGAYYSAALNLNTTELDTALAAATDALDVLVDLEVQNADNSARLTFRLAVKITQQVYSDEADPVPGTPTYPSPSAIMVKNPTGGSYRFKDGNLQFYNQITTKWHTFFPYGPEGSVTSEWGAGEV